MPSLTDAFQDLYTYIISIAGVIALIALIIGGIGTPNLKFIIE